VVIGSPEGDDTPELAGKTRLEDQETHIALISTRPSQSRSGEGHLPW
jgi:hypothetical protein